VLINGRGNANGKASVLPVLAVQYKVISLTQAKAQLSATLSEKIQLHGTLKVKPTPGCAHANVKLATTLSAQTSVRNTVSTNVKVATTASNRIEEC